VRALKEGYLKTPATFKIKKNDSLVKVRDLINLPVLQLPILLRSYYLIIHEDGIFKDYSALVENNSTFIFYPNLEYPENILPSPTAPFPPLTASFATASE
jgi:hypothetical protein